MKKLLFIFSATVLFAAFQSAIAQNLVWAKQFGGIGDDEGRSVAIDAEGNVFTTGFFTDTVDFDPGPGVYNLTSAGNTDIFIAKFDVWGNLVWAKNFGGATSDKGYSIAVDTIGNVYATGYRSNYFDFDPGPGTINLPVEGGWDIFVTKLDFLGNVIWAKGWGGSIDDYTYSIAVDRLGNVYTSGFFSGQVDFDPNTGIFNLSAGNKDVFVSKLDASGNLIWAKQMGGPQNDYSNSMSIDSAGNVYITGNFSTTADFDPGPGTLNFISAGYEDVFIAKLDASGNLVWAKQINGVNHDYGYSIAVDSSENVYATGLFQGTVDFDPGSGTYNLTSTGASVFIIKLDVYGNFVWCKQLGGAGNNHGRSIYIDDSGKIYVAGSFWGTADFDPGPGTYNLTSGNYDVFITVLDVAGNFVWTKKVGGSLPDDANLIAVDASGNMYVTGYYNGTADFDPSSGTYNLTSEGGTDAFFLKISPIIPYVILGQTFGDINADCNHDTMDISLRNLLVKVNPGPFYGLSDESGNYIIYILDSGSYTISLATQDIFWQSSCTASYNIQLTTGHDTAFGIDFPMRASFYCPRLTVELGTPLLRRCFNNTYTISYSNTGTLPASNAYIEVDFGNYLHPQSSTLPWSTVSGNVYTFPVGNINIDQQGSFNITALLNCTADNTQCVTAHIYPDSTCIPAPAGWDKSETKVTGTCINDSLVCFTIKNRSGVGTGDMNGAAQWRLYVNDTLVTRGTYQLAGGDSIVKCYPANGKTYRLEADQNPPHPGNSHPKAIVEACGSPSNFGFVNTVPQDDADLFIETFCMTVIGSYDPNDKQVSPVGITSNKYITAEDELEYMIRFQNTGTDTAFKVVILDTIATNVLDIATLTSGASSHDYTFNIYGHGIAEWTFDNILLPDSNVNEPESHGFVKFKVHQLTGNPDGTRIENRAAIYFDFNAPVITNTAWNEVNEANMPVSFLSTSINNSSNVTCSGIANGSATISASGGLAPFQYSWSSGATTATVSGLAAGNYSVIVTDATGTGLTDSVSISEPSLFEAAIDSKTDVLCYANGTGTATATASGGTPPYSYEWSTTQGSQTATILHAGTYSITVWDANLCTATTSSVTITEPPQLTASISTQSSVTCFGGNDAAVKVIAGGGVPPYSFNWSNGQTSSTANDLSAGNYLLTVTDSNSCWLITSVTIQDGYQVNTGAITGTDTADINQTNTYTVNSGFSYTWSINNGTIISGQNTNSIEVAWSATGQGILEVVATDQRCSETVSKTVTLIDPTGIQQSVLNDIKLYPNPTNETITLTAANIPGQATLKLLDAIGRTVWQQTIQQQELQDGVVINLREMSEGIFFLNIQSKKGSWVMKVVKC